MYLCFIARILFSSGECGFCFSDPLHSFSSFPLVFVLALFLIFSLLSSLLITLYSWSYLYSASILVILHSSRRSSGLVSLYGEWEGPLSLFLIRLPPYRISVIMN